MTALLEMRAITKTFPGVTALSGVSLAVQPGEIHAIVGENGAGKSTLMKVLSGVYPAGSYDGEILLQDQPQRFTGITDSERQGIIIIHQELALIPQLSVTENLFLGHEVSRRGIIDWNEANHRAKALLAKVGLSDSPLTLISDLGVGKQQLVEIAKALGRDVRILILDEPTASLNEADSDRLLGLLVQLKRQGIACILISHKLNEIRRIADRVTVLRDGAMIATHDVGGGRMDEDQIIREMVGRSLAERYPPRQSRPGPVVMEVRNWSVNHHLDPERPVVRDVSFILRAGEVLGISGLMGAGRTELAMSLFGRAYGRRIRGQILIDGSPVTFKAVPDAIAAGLAYVTEDRKALGLILDEDIRSNLPLANLGGIARAGILQEHRATEVASDAIRDLRIKTFGVAQKTGTLSGGNQQKVVLGKWLFTGPRILILDEPTRGIDIGAKFEIYSIINQLAAEGRAILMISSEMPELLGMCDRIHVMNEGRFVGELSREEASQEKIMRLILQTSREH